MKRFMMSILMLFILVTTYAADSGLVDDFAVPVSFTYRSGINLGFSRSQVGIQWVESNLGGEVGYEIKFSYNSGTGKIETGFFYFYAQIYTTDKVEISVGLPNGNSSNPAILTGNNSGYPRDTLEFQSDPQLFTSSSDLSGTTSYTGKVLYDESNKSYADRTLPRVYLCRLNLSVDSDDLVNKTSTQFTGTLVFNVEVQS